MKGAGIVKKTIGAAALGLTLLCTLTSACFFGYMGWRFGYADLTCSEFTETKKFAEELMNQLSYLDSNAYTEDEYALPDKRLEIVRAGYDAEAGLYSSRDEYAKLSGDWILESGSYYYMLDDYGVAEVFSAENEDYNDGWYEIEMSQNEIAETNAFVTLSKEDYIRIIETNGVLNDGSVYMETVLQDDGTASVWSSEMQNDSFPEDAYIGFYENNMIVYSPSEDMFYSSIYGWYKVPDVLYFSKAEFSDACWILEQDGYAPELGIMLLSFTSSEKLFQERIGADYLDYLRATMNLELAERNIVYYVSTGSRVYTNTGTLTSLLHCKEYVRIYMTDSGEYAVTCVGFENRYLTDEYVGQNMQYMTMLKPDSDTEQEDSGLYLGMYVTYPYTDLFSEENQVFSNWYPYTIPALIAAVLFGIASVVLLVWLLRTAGRSSAEDTVVRLNGLDKCPVELVLLMLLFSAALFAVEAIYVSQIFSETYGGGDMIEYIGNFALAYTLAITSILSMVRRGKAKAFWQYSLIRWCVRLMRRLVKAFENQKSLRARAIERAVLYWLVMLTGGVLLLWGQNNLPALQAVGILLMVFLNIGTLTILIQEADGRQRIRDMSRQLAEGNLELPEQAKKYPALEQEVMDNMNHIDDGLQRIVEKSIADERMKAELITNVSHDIKTPLTSIINYVDLIKRENVENENVRHYIEILDKKSWRLKQLTEDLVEISKITTGNLELEPAPIDLGELLRQSLGEFEDKFRLRELRAMETIPEEPHTIFADGRRTYRVLDNLFQNVYKYAMPGTRVYIDLTHVDRTITLSIKNISQAPLNIDAEELMERFVRGDQARTTEGSGLGLSIAKELVELQNGAFHIYLDGDLFKVVLCFTEYVAEEAAEAHRNDDTSSETYADASDAENADTRQGGEPKDGMDAGEMEDADAHQNDDTDAQEAAPFSTSDEAEKSPESGLEVF